MEQKTKKIDTNTNYTIWHILESEIKKRYNIRYNEISLAFEIEKNGSWVILNEFNIFIELNKNGVKCTMNQVIQLLKSDFVNKVNPLKDYFAELKFKKVYDGGDYIGQLCKYITTTEPLQFEYHFKKWLVRAVKCAITPNYYNKQAFILVQKNQNSGKSTFCRFLCPPKLSQYIAEDISNDKDARILLCKNFLINLDELAVLSYKEINSLKSYFSKTQINERLPYDNKNSILQRVSSFIGSTNMATFLNDESGSVRWLCFDLLKIDFSYSTKINIDKVYAHAQYLLDTDFQCELTQEDIRENEKRNDKYQINSTEYELISKHFLEGEEYSDTAKFFTASDVLTYLGGRYSHKMHTIGIGKALNKLNFKRIKHKKEQTYGYFLKERI